MKPSNHDREVIALERKILEMDVRIEDLKAELMEANLVIMKHKTDTVLHRELDPDPYGLHGLSMVHRFSCMIREFGE
jgi:hypothetical protein